MPTKEEYLQNLLWDNWEEKYKEAIEKNNLNPEEMNEDSLKLGGIITSVNEYCSDPFNGWVAILNDILDDVIAAKGEESKWVNWFIHSYLEFLRPYKWIEIASADEQQK